MMTYRSTSAVHMYYPLRLTRKGSLTTRERMISCRLTVEVQLANGECIDLAVVNMTLCIGMNYRVGVYER